MVSVGDKALLFRNRDMMWLEESGSPLVGDKGFLVRNKDGNFFLKETSVSIGNKGRLFNINNTFYLRAKKEFICTACTDTGLNVNNAYDLILFDNKLYVSTNDGNVPKIYSYDGANWTSAGQLSTGIGAICLAVLDDTLYAGSGYSGGNHVFRYDGGTSWSIISPALDSGGYGVMVLKSFDNTLYAGTDGHARVKRWDGDSNWTGIFSYGSLTSVQTLTTHGSKLYNGIHGGVSQGRAYEYQSDSNWTYIGKPGITWFVLALKSYGNELYAGTFYSGTPGIYRWEGGESWTFVQSGSANCFTVFEDKLFAGMYDGNIYSYNGNEWKFEIKCASTINNALQGWNGNLYLACSNGHVYALN